MTDASVVKRSLILAPKEIGGRSDRGGNAANGQQTTVGNAVRGIAGRPVHLAYVSFAAVG